MLRSSTARLRERVARQYVCWSCSIKKPNQTVGSRQASTIRPRCSAKVSWSSQRQFNTGRADRATVETETATAISRDELMPRSDIRERLRKWELENSDIPFLTNEIYRPSSTTVVNQTGVTSTGEAFVDNDGEDLGDLEEPQAKERDQVDVGLRRNFLLPGDMVEILFNGGIHSELAVFVQEFAKQTQFYTMSGRWIHKSEHTVKYFLPDFVDPAQLEDIKPYLPKEDVTEELMDKVQSKAVGAPAVPRNIGKPLIQKMQAFWEESDTAYRTAAVTMDNAHKLAAVDSTFTYATLAQIADRILTNVLPKGDNGQFAPATLYALHRSLMRVGGFRLPCRQVMRGESEYEISATKEMVNVELVTRKLREHRSVRSARRRGISTKPDSLDLFVKEARKFIDNSRRFRDFTPCGILGPSKKVVPEGKVITQASRIDGHHEWLDFLQSWACLKSFGVASHLNGIGSQILSAIDRYPNVALNKSTAFTCLMELGVVSPWESVSSFELRLPDVCPLTSGASLPSTQGVTSDSLTGIRKEWDGNDVYCIDDVGAHEIDDGMSVEVTDNPEEYWIHIHVADPAAHLQHEGAAAWSAKNAVKTVYLADRTMPMLDIKWVHENLSLQNGKPCLTHSIKINGSTGDILDVDITPHFIKNVHYITPSVLQEALTEARPIPPTVLQVGKFKVADTSPSRPLLDAKDLSSKQLDDFKLLQILSNVRLRAIREKGAISGFAPMSSTSVSFGAIELPAKDTRIPHREHHHDADPSISVAVPPVTDEGVDANRSDTQSIVSTMMLLAAEATAKWCNARGIPVIYRISPSHPTKDPLKYYQEHVHPTRDEHGNLDMEAVDIYLRLVGRTQPCTTPGPHLAIGADMSMQVTSPLRRFGDLCNQWQIEAALLKEAETGTSLIGNVKDDFFPYTKAQIDQFLPRLAEQEKVITIGERVSRREWILKYLVRAWKFGEDTIPSTMLFNCKSVDVASRTATGMLPYYNIFAVMPIPEGIAVSSISAGDVFKVELEIVNVYDSALDVKYLQNMSPS